MRARALVTAGLGASLDPISISGSVDADVVRVRIDAGPRSVLPVGGALPLHAEAWVARERFRPGGHEDAPVTTRVFDFPAPARRVRSRSRPPSNLLTSSHRCPRLSLKGPALAAIVVVPLTGAAEAPGGWLLAVY